MKFLYLILFFLFFSSCHQDKISQKSIDLNNQAVNSIINEKYDDALKFGDKAIIEDQNNYNAYTIKAQMLVKKNKLNEALKVMETLLKLKPQFAEGWTFKGIINDLNGNQKLANLDYKKSIQIYRKRNKINEVNLQVNVTNMYCSLVLLNDKESKAEMMKLEHKWKNDQSTYNFLLSLKEHGKKELINQMLIE